MIEINVIQLLRLRNIHIVSSGLGTFMQIADHVDRKIVARQVHRMSKLPLPEGENVHPCKAIPINCTPSE